MAEGKKSFLAYCDWKDTFDSLPDEKAGQLIKHVFAYVNDEDPKTDDILINAVFANIKNTLKRDLVKYDTFLEKQRHNGKKGGRPRGGADIGTTDGRVIPKESTLGHFIYLIYNNIEDTYKIGETSNLLQRRLDIKKPTKQLEIVTFEMMNVYDAQKLELQILSDYKEFSIGGDWFRFTIKERDQIKATLSSKTQAFRKIPKKADSVSVRVTDRERDINKTTLKSCNVPYVKFGEAYFKQLENHGKIKSSQKINNAWLDPIRLLCNEKGVTLEEITNTAKMYFERIDEEYMLECYSTKSFRDKYFKLKSKLQTKNEPATKKEESAEDYAKRRFHEKRKRNGISTDGAQPLAIDISESANDS